MHGAECARRQGREGLRGLWDWERWYGFPRTLLGPVQAWTLFCFYSNVIARICGKFAFSRCTILMPYDFERHDGLGVYLASPYVVERGRYLQGNLEGKPDARSPCHPAHHPYKDIVAAKKTGLTSPVAKPGMKSAGPSEPNLHVEQVWPQAAWRKQQRRQRQEASQIPRRRGEVELLHGSHTDRRRSDEDHLG